MNTLTRPCTILGEETAYVESLKRGYRPGDGDTPSPDSETPAVGSDGLRALDALGLEFPILLERFFPLLYHDLYTMTVQIRHRQYVIAVRTFLVKSRWWRLGCSGCSLVFSLGA